jgi:hypothetical protein
MFNSSSIPNFFSARIALRCTLWLNSAIRRAHFTPSGPRKTWSEVWPETFRWNHMWNAAITPMGSGTEILSALSELNPLFQNASCKQNASLPERRARVLPIRVTSGWAGSVVRTSTSYSAMHLRPGLWRITRIARNLSLPSPERRGSLRLNSLRAWSGSSARASNGSPLSAAASKGSSSVTLKQALR